MERYLVEDGLSIELVPFAQLSNLVLLNPDALLKSLISAAHSKFIKTHETKKMAEDRQVL